MATLQPDRTTSPAGATRLDPITFEVLRNALMTIADEMGLKLFRASFSPPVNQGRDFSIAIFDREGELVTAGHFDMPIHYGTFQYTIREIRRVLGDEHIRPDSSVETLAALRPILGRDDPVDEPRGFRLLGRDKVAGQEHHRLFGAGTVGD